MKRSLALQPLSREHHAALKLAKACARAATSEDAERISEACRQVAEALEAELEPHLQTEERELLPAVPGALAAHTLADHARLRELAAELRRHCTAGTLLGFGDALAAHVRFEERELFPAIEGLQAEEGE